MAKLRAFLKKSEKALTTGWMLTALLIAVYIGVVEPRQRYRGISESKVSGLAALEEARPFWAPRQYPEVSRGYGVVGGVSGEIRSSLTAKIGAASMAMAGDSNQAPAPAPPPPPSPNEDRKLVRTGAMDLVVKSPAETSEKIRQLAEQMGGFLVSSQVNGADSSVNAAITIRVPAVRFEEARQQIRKLGLRIDSDRMEAEDVTKNYVDRQARLRNLRAQEQQYLLILKRASTVKDTLEVSEHLNEVRGQIEQEQAEFDALSKQIETVVLTVSLRAEVDTQVFGLHWRPLLRLKIAAREGLEGLGDYLASMVSLVFFLPTILLWLVTILIGAAFGWRILRWGARTFFGFPKSVTTEKAVG